MGSLFKARDLWNVKLNQDEEVDRGCMALGNIDNDSSNQDKIVVGSFQGVLRIFNPKGRGFRPEELLLEQQLEAPVLQVLTGKFVSGSKNTFICVLHPRKVVVFGVSRAGGGGDSSDPLGRHYSLAKQYEHRLERTAYNMVCGPFGSNTTGYESLCVQSMDGQVSFFEQEKPMFSRFFPSTTFLVPGHLCYNAKSDGFLTNTSTFEIEFYRYSTFAMSSASEQKDTKEAQGRRLSPDWSINLGEVTVDIRVAKVTRSLSQNQVDIIVLGERTLYFLKENGELRYQKRLDFFPTYLCPYVSRQEGKFCNLLVGAHSGTMLVYDDTHLVWAAKLTASPLCLAVSTMCKTDGMIMVLGDDNSISVNYLGTDPATQPVQLLESKELDYEEMDDEHRRLQAMIRQAVNSGKTEPKDQVQLNYELNQELDSLGPSGFGGRSNAAGQRCVTARIFLSYQGIEDVENFILTINCSAPITVNGDTSVHIPVMQAAPRPMVVPVTFILSPDAERFTPTSLIVDLVGAYTLGSGEPLTCRCQFVIPMTLIAHVTPPIKAATYKITLETNRMPPSLVDLFEDVTQRSTEVTPNSLSLVYPNGLDATILVSRNAGRFRVQSNSFPALWIMSSELVRRLKAHFVSAHEPANQEPFKIEFTEALPFNEYFAIMEAHYTARQALAVSQQTLSERAHQFRSIQKRLLVRFKDRNPSPMNNLDSLFEDTFKQLIAIANEVDKLQNELALTANALVCATHLILLLMRYALGSNLSKEDFKTLQHHLTPIVMDFATQGWEECIDAAMTHLLRTSLAKNVKESSSLPQPIAPPPDTQKVRKHITLVWDRLQRGGSLKDTKKSWEVQEKKDQK